MPEPLRWGILGTGNIAEQFCSHMPTARRGRVVAVASRSMDSARAFAERFSITSAYGSYADLLTDRGIDAVYISLPNSMHHEWTIRSLRAGKHVLCEKPFATNAEQSQEMFDEAGRAGRLLVEAFMYLSHPQTIAVIESVHSGEIGSLQLIRTSFCYRTRRIDGNIRFRPDLAGGALMDIGCYCTSLACVLAQEDPVEIHASARLHSSGVDEITTGVLRFPGGLLSSFTCGMTLQADNTAYLCGTEGYLEVPVPWKPASRGAVHTLARSTPPRQDAPRAGGSTPPPRIDRTVDAGQDLYALEVDDFAAAVQDARPPRVSREMTLRNMRILDEIRRQVGVKF
jgi:D-xylose 1-dehydrogenase (NADP+, D-xylono-1,5-lactone-forming)